MWSVQAKRARQNLRDNVRRVLLGAPAEYGEMKLEITAWQYSVHNVISKLKKEHRGSKSNQTNYHIKTFLESTHGWYSSFMFQLLDKLSEYGGAENLNFDWWSPKEMTHAADKTEDTDNANKANIQQILLSICYKVIKKTSMIDVIENIIACIVVSFLKYQKNSIALLPIMEIDFPKTVVEVEYL